MKVVLFGGSGMVGQGVLRECLLDPQVEQVLAVVRRPLDLPDGWPTEKLSELAHGDFSDFGAVAERFRGYDACFYCLGVTSTGLSETDYTRVTYDMTLAAARPLAEVNPDLTFVFVSGRGTDSTEQGRIMWARVKGRAENAVVKLFANGYAVRPGLIRPLHGITSRTRLYRIGLVVGRPLWPLLQRLFPNAVVTTEELGRAMLNVARSGFPKRVLESADLRTAAAG